MQYILDALTGKAKDSAAHFSILPGELDKLMRHLDSRFGDQQKLRQLYSHDLLAMAPLDSNSSVVKVREHIDWAPVLSKTFWCQDSLHFTGENWQGKVDKIH